MRIYGLPIKYILRYSKDTNLENFLGRRFPSLNGTKAGTWADQRSSPAQWSSLPGISMKECPYAAGYLGGVVTAWIYPIRSVRYTWLRGKTLHWCLNKKSGHATHSTSKFPNTNNYLENIDILKSRGKEPPRWFSGLRARFESVSRWNDQSKKADCRRKSAVRHRADITYCIVLQK